MVCDDTKEKGASGIYSLRRKQLEKNDFRSFYIFFFPSSMIFLETKSFYTSEKVWLAYPWGLEERRNKQQETHAWFLYLKSTALP
jgi:hypothetical protein